MKKKREHVEERKKEIYEGTKTKKKKGENSASDPSTRKRKSLQGARQSFDVNRGRKD